MEDDKTSLITRLKLADRSLTKEGYPMHATPPLPQPKTLFRTGRIKIGLSISAGNQAKIIPPGIWRTFFDRLSDLPCLCCILLRRMNLSTLLSSIKVAGERDNLVNMTGNVSLEGLYPMPSARQIFISPTRRTYPLF